MKRWEVVSEQGPQVRIERGGKYDNFRVMVNRRDGSGWVRKDRLDGFATEAEAVEYIERRLAGLKG